MEQSDLKMYIAVLDSFPDYMVPTLVAHSVLSAHMNFYNSHGEGLTRYNEWLYNSFKKCVVKVNQKEFDRILKMDHIVVGHENNTLNGKDSCIVVCPRSNDEYPNVIKFAKLWKPKYEEEFEKWMKA